MQWSERLGPLRSQAFRAFLGARTISLFGDNLNMIAIAFAVLALENGSPAYVGIALAARSIPMAVFVLVGGVWADRLPRQQLMIASDLLRAMAQGALGVLLVTDRASIWQILALQAAHGLGSAFFQPASSGLVPQTVAGEHLQHANALVVFADAAATTGGPAVSGAIVVTVGPAWAILTDSATFAVSALLLTRLRGLPPIERTENERFVREFSTGLRAVTGRGWVWISVLGMGIFQFIVLGALFTVGPVVAERSLGGAGVWGALLSVFGLGFIGGSILAYRVQPERPMFAAFAAGIVVGPVFLLLAVPASALAIGAWLFVVGVVIALGDTLWATTLQEKIPAATLARVSSFDWLAGAVMYPVGLVTFGALAEAAGVAPTLYGAFVAFTVVSISLVFSSPIRRLRRGPEDPAAPWTGGRSLVQPLEEE